MTEMQKVCLGLIDAQQAGMKEGSIAYCLGEQLREIAEREPASAEIMAEDLEKLTLPDAERELKAYADKNHGRERAFGISPKKAEEILRKFYGLPDAGAEQPPEPPETEDFDLMAFL